MSKGHYRIVGIIGRADGWHDEIRMSKRYPRDLYIVERCARHALDRHPAWTSAEIRQGGLVISTVTR